MRFLTVLLLILFLPLSALAQNGGVVERPDIEMWRDHSAFHLRDFAQMRQISAADSKPSEIEAQWKRWKDTKWKDMRPDDKNLAYLLFSHIIFVVLLPLVMFAAGSSSERGDFGTSLLWGGLYGFAIGLLAAFLIVLVSSHPVALFLAVMVIAMPGVVFCAIGLMIADVALILSLLLSALPISVELRSFLRRIGAFLGAFSTIGLIIFYGAYSIRKLIGLG